MAIIANGLRTPNVNVRAVQDRGHIVLFEPSAVEVHLRAARWFRDQAVFDFIGGNLQLAERLSMRDYTLGWELKQAGLDWQDWLLAKWGLSGTRRAVARLKADSSFQSERRRPAIASLGDNGLDPLWQGALAPRTRRSLGRVRK